MTTKMTPELSPDLVEEILCRVPAAYLEQLRPTCKRWNRLIKEDKRFQRKHFDKAAKQFSSLIFRYDSRGCSLSLDLYWMLRLIDPHSYCKFDIRTVFHCDGLLLCTSEDRSTIVVWNPCTRETKWIRTKNLFGRCHNFYLGYCKDNESGIKSYKFLSRHGLGHQDPLIYDFDSDSWRIVDDVTQGWSTAYNEYGVSLKGSIYWIVSHVYDKNGSKCLLRFDFSTEKSQPVALPYQRSWYVVLCLSVVRDEKLSVLVQLDDSVSKTEIWVTNKIDETSKVVSWSKVLALDLSPDLQLSNEGSFLLDEEKKEVMCCEKFYDEIDESKSKDMLYIVGEDNKVTPMELGVDVDDGGLPAILNYFSSLVRIKPAGGKRKRAD